MVRSGQPSSILALDVGAARIGVARASSVARLAEPVGAVNHDDQVWRQLAELCQTHNAEALVVGLPRGMNGQETAQTATVRQFVDQLARHTDIPIQLQDEAVTSVKAEAELNRRGKPYSKADIDALAATYILDDYLATDQHAKL